MSYFLDFILHFCRLKEAQKIATGMLAHYPVANTKLKIPIGWIATAQDLVSK